MKIYTLLQTDSDRAWPNVEVYGTAEEAIAVGRSDIAENGAEVVYDEMVEWAKETRVIWASEYKMRGWSSGLIM